MSVKKKMNLEELEKVVGGNSNTGYVNVKTIITYKRLGQEESEPVTLRVEAVNGNVTNAAIDSAVMEWCNNNSYEFMNYIIAFDNDYFVVY